MALDFPDVPTIGAYYTSGVASWRWDGFKWMNAYSSTTGPFLPLTGGTVTGNTSIQFDSTGNNAINFTPVSVYNTNVSGQQMHSHMIVASTGGTAGSVYANTVTGSAIQGAPDNYIWNQLNIVDYGGTGGQGQHVASYNQAIRRTVHAGGRPNNPDMFAAVFEVVDYANTVTSATGASMNGIEVDMTCGNVDDAKMRRGIGIYINKASPSDVAPTVDIGLHMAGITGRFLSMIRLESYFDVAAIDLRTLVPTGAAPAIWLGDNLRITWNTAATAATYWDTSMFSGAGGLYFTNNVRIDGDVYIPNNMTLGGVLTGVQEVQATELVVGSLSGPSWTQGTAAPTANKTVGSLYSRVGGAVGSTLYVSRGSGTWAAVAGV